MVEEDDDNLHLRVSIGDITIEAAGPVDEAESWFEALREDYLSNVDSETIEKAVDGSGSIATNPESDSASPDNSADTMSSRKSRSLVEFYKTAENPTKRDSALIVGWYLEYHEDQDDFIKPEVEERAQDAKISLGANVSRDLSNQVNNGHLEKVDERDGQDAYHLTLTGEGYVEENLLET